MGYQLPDDVKEDYNWLDIIDTELFVVYNDNYYWIGEFMRVDVGQNEAFEGWDAYLNETAFSGLVIKMSDDNDLYEIGRFL